MYVSYGSPMFLLDIALQRVVEDKLPRPADWPENLDGSLTHYPHAEETYLVMLTSCFGSGLCPQLLESSCGFQLPLSGLSLLRVVQK